MTRQLPLRPYFRILLDLFEFLARVVGFVGAFAISFPFATAKFWMVVQTILTTTYIGALWITNDETLAYEWMRVVSVGPRVAIET